MPELPQTVCAHDAGGVSGAPYREKQENAVPVLRAERVSQEDADEVRGTCRVLNHLQSAAVK